MYFVNVHVVMHIYIIFTINRRPRGPGPRDRAQTEGNGGLAAERLGGEGEAQPGPGGRETGQHEHRYLRNDELRQGAEGELLLIQNTVNILAVVDFGKCLLLRTIRVVLNANMFQIYCYFNCLLTLF